MAMTLYDELYALYGSDVVDMLPPWMSQHPALAVAFLDEVVEAGGTSITNAADIAIERLRAAPEHRALYDSIFQGSRRDDGTLRHTEAQYFARVQGYKDALQSVAPNMNVDVFMDDYPNLIAGDVDPAEFGRRVDALYSRVIDNAGAIRDLYAAEWGVDMTDEGILASLMSPGVQDAVLSKRITMAEIGGEASMRNFDITQEFVEMLAEEGQMDRDEAQRLFGSAAQILPALSALARRHGDADDTFDITEFAAAASDIADPEQLSRISRLQSQEQSQFTGGAELEFERSRATGGVSGLAPS